MNCTHAQGATVFEAVTGQDLISSQKFHQLTTGLVVGQSTVEMCSAVNPMGLVTLTNTFPSVQQLKGN